MQTIAEIGSNAEKSFIAQGKAVASPPIDETADPIYHMLITTTNVNWFASWLNTTYNINITGPQIKHTSTYEELETLIKGAIAKRNTTNVQNSLENQYGC
jgi:hypothetical protein